MHVLSILAADPKSGSGSLAGLFVPMLLIGAAMYFLMIRPQRRKMRSQTQLQSSIDVGDEVMTTSGMYGHRIEASLGIGYARLGAPITADAIKATKWEIGVGDRRVLAQAQLGAWYDAKGERIKR